MLFLLLLCTSQDSVVLDRKGGGDVIGLSFNCLKHSFFKLIVQKDRKRSDQ